MAKTERIFIKENKVSFETSGLLCSEDLAQTRKLFLVHHSDPLFHGDEPFYVLELENTLWLIPDNVIGLPDVVSALSRHLGRENCLRARCTKLPFSCRRRLWGVPLFPVPRLSSLDMPLDRLLTEIEPLSPEDYARLEQGRA